MNQRRVVELKIVWADLGECIDSLALCRSASGKQEDWVVDQALGHVIGRLSRTRMLLGDLQIELDRLFIAKGVKDLV